MAKSGISVFSFFSGLGILDLGLRDAGMDLVFENEIKKSLADGNAYAKKAMGIKAPKYGMSVQSVMYHLQTSNLKKLGRFVSAEKKLGKVVGFVGGPPCPDFSIAGTNRGQKGENGKLTGAYIRLILLVKPDFFIFENVLGLWRTKKHRAYFDRLKLKLEKGGYFLTNRVVNSIEYDAAQDRRRILLIGGRGKYRVPIRDFDWKKNVVRDVSILKKDFWPKRDKFSFGSRTVKPAWIPKSLTIQYWFSKNKVVSHPNSKNFFAPKAGLDKMKTKDEGDTGGKSFKRLHRWRYSPTAAYGNNEVHLHPYLHRRISVAEAAAIQSLPEKFSLPQTMTLSDMFKGVGNAVPYNVAKGIGKELVRSLRRAR